MYNFVDLLTQSRVRPAQKAARKSGMRAKVVTTMVQLV